MNITYATENDKNGKARYYRVTDGKKKVISRAEYEAHTSDVNSETPAIEAVSTLETEENVQIAFEETTSYEDGTCASSVEDTAEAEETDDEPINKELAYEAVRGIVKATGTEHFEKMYLQDFKKCALINYRNCAVCSLVFDESGAITAVRFMGTTVETRKKLSTYNIACLDELSAYENKIIEQINFIDWWYTQTAKTSAKAS